MAARARTPLSTFGEVPAWGDTLVEAARTCGEDVSAAVALAREYGTRLPLPGDDTATRWSVLAAVAEVNLTVARVLEAHTDALAILAEVVPDGRWADEPGAWGVFAAEAPGVRLDAEVADDDVSATLSGAKAWCSLAAELDCALVTAHTPHGRRLFRVALTDPSVRPEPAGSWVARGLRTVTSAPVHFDRSPATAVGAPEWYLVRPGFAWGGLGVAACWFGGAAGLLSSLLRRARKSGAELDALHLGGADVALAGARASLTAAAALIDTGAKVDGELLALRVRSVVADAAERVLQHAAHALGPAPLAFDGDHAARVADLELYVRQHHAERDLVSLGRMLADDRG